MKRIVIAPPFQAFERASRIRLVSARPMPRWNGERGRSRQSAAPGTAARQNGRVAADVPHDASPSLVLVSHSASIAEGVAELVRQVAGGDVIVQAVGGGPQGTLGTDGAEVLRVLREVAGGVGAVVLMDLGSSILAVRAALDELSPTERARIVLADAPLVEGAVAAGVVASTGATREEVAAAAEEARSAPKL
jgi:PTS hybrid protein